jgi:hypothetical protein
LAELRYYRQLERLAALFNLEILMLSDFVNLVINQLDDCVYLGIALCCCEFEIVFGVSSLKGN